jgi:hypothetical protein
MSDAESAEVDALVRQTDSRDRRTLYLAWCRLARYRSAIVPSVAAAFAATREERGRESQIYGVTPFARFDEGAVELGLRALRDPRQAVRVRACSLLAHSGRAETIPEIESLAKPASRPASLQAVRALREGRPFGADDDPVYFAYGHEPYRAPRGTFATQLDEALGGWLEQRGFRPTWVFQHRFEYGSADRSLSAIWDSYDVVSHVSVGAPGSPPSPTAGLPGGPGDLARLIQRIRAAVRGKPARSP